MLRLAARGLTAITVTLLIACAAGLMILSQRGERLLSVKSARLAPALQPGDAVIVGPGGQPSAVLPGMGRWLDILSKPAVLVVAVYLPAGLVMAAETRRMTNVYARPFYSVRL